MNRASEWNHPNGRSPPLADRAPGEPDPNGAPLEHGAALGLGWSRDKSHNSVHIRVVCGRPSERN